jgi:dipeptidase
MLIPDGYVCAHANQARITTFDYQKKNDWFNPTQTVFNSKDVISFAREMKYFDGKDEEFSFSDTYAPVDFGAARFCEMRVWAFFNSVAGGMDKYWEYAKGNVQHGKWEYATNRMPLWINQLANFHKLYL